MGIVILFMVLVVALGVLGFWGVRKLEEFEAEAAKQQVVKGTPFKAAQEAQPAPAIASQESESELEERILEQVEKAPGMLQADIYELLPDQDRRTVQSTMREMDKAGALVRQKEGGTYKLFLK